MEFPRLVCVCVCVCVCARARALKGEIETLIAVYTFN